MKKLVSWLIWFPIGVLAVVFFVANRQFVAISLDPFSPENPAIATPALPLWFWLTLFLLVGFFAGGLGMWASERPARRKARAEIRALKAELRTRERAAEPANSSDNLPTLKAS